jgi:hypothetical protein
MTTPTPIEPSEISPEWQKAWLQMKSALAEAEGLLSKADEFFGDSEVKTQYPFTCKEWFASRHPAEPETKTGE